MSHAAEQSVLGAIMLDSRAYHRCAAIIGPDDFTSPEHRALWLLLAELIETDAPVDAVTIGEIAERRNLEVGGLGYVLEVCNNTPGSASADAYAEIVRGASIRRQLRPIGRALSVIESTGENALDEALAMLAGIQCKQRTESVTLVSAMAEVYAQMCERDDGIKPPVTPGPLVALNRKMGGGFGHGHLIIVAGRPGSGKTAFARDCAIAAADHGSVGFISLEMSRHELAGMMMARCGNYSYQHVRDPSGLDGDWSQVTAGMVKLKLPIHICDQAALSFPAISSEARRLNAKTKLARRVVDYLGLIDMPKAERNDISVGMVTRGFKRLGKELGIPVVLLCQLSRKCEERANKRPMLSDLRDAGQIEQDADVILMLYRDKYYAELEGRVSPFGDIAEINVAKQRHGPPGVVPAIFRGEQITFADYSGEWPIEQSAPSAPKKGFKPR